MKSKDKNLQGYDSSGTGQDDSKNSAPSANFRKTRNTNERRITRNKYSKAKRPKYFEEEEEDSEIDIPKDYLNLFGSFKHFIDELITEHLPQPAKTKMAKNGQKKSRVSSKTSNKDSELNQSYAGENQSKFMHDTENQMTSNYSQDQRTTKNSANMQHAQNQEMGRRSPQGGLGHNNTQNNQELLMQLLMSQANPMQSHHGFGHMGGMGGDHLNPYAQAANPMHSLQANSQSLLLLQRIIQTTPEIQILHQQEQIALFQIQQNIKTALTQNLGQEVISQLVLDYQKTQEQHQLNIQAAIQRKLTMILCQNNPHFMSSQQPQMVSQHDYDNNQDDDHIENRIFNYSRSSYHLGIAYFIYNEKKNEYRRQQLQMQQNAQMRQGNQMRQTMMQSSQNSRDSSGSQMQQNQMQGMHPTLIQMMSGGQSAMQQRMPQQVGQNFGIQPQGQQTSAPQMPTQSQQQNMNFQQNKSAQSQVEQSSYNIAQHLSRAYEDAKNDTKDINSKVDDLMNS